MQREIPSAVDQVHLEVVELQRQVAELRKHLKMLRPQGEPSYREHLQREVGAGHACLPPSSPTLACQLPLLKADMFAGTWLDS